jgi:spore maturation protein CgeB/Tfp pilus assembly protein PilF/ubiquinone/menaquinone biosynthesis C-methylase UbiE
MVSSLNILTFNWHEIYICLLARTGFSFIVAEPDNNGTPRRWDTRMRPVPDNVRIVTTPEWHAALRAGAFDLVIAHNPVQDLPHLVQFDVPKILVLHNKLSTSLALGNAEDDAREISGKIKNDLFAATPNLRLVFISDTKRADWGLDGTVIRPGIDPAEYGGYRGELARVLRVGNLFKERDLMLGYSHQEAILRGLPSTVLGMNPGIRGSRLSHSFDDLREHYRSHRLFLNTTVDGREDGYNLATLEAMATGMPVVSTVNGTSPIRDGENGYISADFDELHERICELLGDPERARRLGAEARRTVCEQFPIEEFVRNWQAEIDETLAAVSLSTASRTRARSPTKSVAAIANYEFDPELRAAIPKRHPTKIEPRDLPFGPPPRRRNILMAYTANPTTTATFLERALRRRHHVVTCGPTISDELLADWNMSAVRDKVKPHDIAVPAEAAMADIMQALPASFAPELFLWVESGMNFTPPDIRSLDCPKACYLIDSHLNLDWHRTWARLFDFVFVAQRQYLPVFTEAGCPEVHWLPLACDPSLHRKLDVEKKYDVGFVGSINSSHARRKELLERLSQHFAVRFDRCFLHDMVKLFNESRIVFNNALKDDMNMRVFEALACGSLLVTDRADGSGLEELFRDEEHLVIYDDANLIDTVRYYLEHDDVSEKIARRGREQVLARHTYAHRAAELERVVFTVIEKGRKATGSRDRYAPGGYARRERTEIVTLVPQTAASVLDVGCAAGETGRLLREAGYERIVGIERDAESAARARDIYDEVFVGDVEHMELPFEPGAFDCIIFADVLEHLVEPEELLRRFRDYLSADGVVVASIPNVRNLWVIHNLVEGYWRYTDEGILDRTHLRFFTYTEIERMFDAAGYEIVGHGATINRQFENVGLGPDGTFSFGRVTLRGLSADELRDLLTYQHLITARKKVDDPVARARTCIESGQIGEALKMVQTAPVSKTKEPELLIVQGECLAKLERFTEAEAAYRAAAEQDPRSDRAYTGLGAALVLQNKHEQALECFRHAVELNPHSDKAHSGMGLALWAAGERHRALDAFSRALDENHENIPALMNLVHVGYEANNLEPARQYLTRYLEYYPANFDVLFILAGALYTQGDFDGARTAIATILEFNPTRQDALDLLAKIHAADRRTSDEHSRDVG